MVTVGDIAKRVRLTPLQVERVLRLKHGPDIKPKIVEKVFAVAVELGFDFGQINFVERREHPRRKVSIRTRISVYRKNGKLHDRGQATIRDISIGGAKLTDVKLPKRSFPAEPFTIVIQPLKGGENGTKFNAELVRVHTGKPYGYGVKFRRFEPGNEGRKGKSK